VEVPVPVKIQKASDSCAENPVFFMVIWTGTNEQEHHHVRTFPFILMIYPT
jgi:hypothetical protein